MDFNRLDYNGQVERLDGLAREALSAYGLPGATAELHTYTNNAVYHVTDGDSQYALRIHRPGLKRLAWIRSELAWLAAIRRDTPLLVPKPAGPVYTGALDGVEGPVYCDLFEWLDGHVTTEPGDVSLEQVAAAGAFMARLHDYSTRYEPPEDFVRPRLDWGGFFGRQSADGIRSPFYSQREDHFFTSEQRALIDQVTARVRQAMDALDAAGDAFGLIHGDMVVKNVLFTADGRVGAIDFDDCVFGYHLYDLASYLWRAKAEPNYADIRAALWSGYTGIRPGAHGDYLETFVAARHVASCRWIAGNAGNPAIRDRAPEIIAARMDGLERYMLHGEI